MKVTWCRFCQREIIFHKLVINDRTGNPLPLDADTNIVHNCRDMKVNEEYRIAECIRYVAYINSLLDTAELTLVRGPKA
jgi:hypothetical protein